MFVYIGTTENKIGVFEIQDETGDLIRTVEIVDPVIDADHLPPPPQGIFSGIKSKMEAGVTEWILKHPKLDLMYAFTSFMTAAHEARVTTYQMDSSSGKLTKLGVCSTGGMQAAYATFSPDQSLLVVAHHNDGRLTFFDCNAHGGVLEAPIRVVETPEVNPGTRSTEFPRMLPSLHHCLYTPDGKFLLTVDCSKQTRIWTYPVDEHGMVLSDEPSSNAKVAPMQPGPTTLVSLIMDSIFQNPGRLRRVAIHPQGRYLYVLYEARSLIQVYEITKEGKILLDCLQEIPSVDPSFYDQTLPTWKQAMAGMAKTVGMAYNVAAEFMATKDGLWVSNRGGVLVGKGDNNMRCFEYQDDGAKLVLKCQLEPQGPVRHFAYLENGANTKIITGMNMMTDGLVETFVKTDKDGEFQRVGQAATGLDCMCILTV